MGRGEAARSSEYGVLNRVDASGRGATASRPFAACRPNLELTSRTPPAGRGKASPCTPRQGGRGEATPLPSFVIRNLYSVLCPLVSTFPQAVGRFAPSHISAPTFPLYSILQPTSPLCWLLRNLYSVLCNRVQPFHFCTGAPLRFAPLHCLRNPPYSVLRTRYSHFFRRIQKMMPPAVSKITAHAKR